MLQLITSENSILGSTKLDTGIRLLGGIHFVAEITVRPLAVAEMPIRTTDAGGGGGRGSNYHHALLAARKG